MPIPGLELHDAIGWGLIAGGTTYHLLRSLGPQLSIIGAALAAFGAKALVLNMA